MIKFKLGVMMTVPTLGELAILSVIGFIMFFVVGYFRYGGVSKEVADIIREIVKHFSGRPFSVNEAARELDVDKKILEKALKVMEEYDLVTQRRDKKYEFKEGFLFMSKEKYEEAKRVLVGDKILYGSYQHFVLARPWLLILPVSILILAGIFLYLAYTNAFGIDSYIRQKLSADVSVDLFYLFVAAYAVVVAEAVLRFIRTFGEQIYTVVVGEKGGIIFVEHIGGGFTGRISRGQIRDVRVKITPFQRFYSFFAPVPVGNVEIIYTGPKEELEIKEEMMEEEKEEKKKTKGERKERKPKATFTKPVVPVRKGRFNHLTFYYMPYPNLLAGIIRGVMLRNLGWRIRHAERIAMWRIARGGGAAVMIGRR